MRRALYPVFLLLGTCASLFGQLNFNTMPLRPAQLLAGYEGAFHPVVSIAGESSPVILLGNQKKRLKGNSRTAFRTGTEFAPGTIGFNKAELTNWTLQQSVDFIPLSEVPLNTTFRAQIESTVDLTDVFVTLIIFDSEIATDTPPAFGLRTLNVGKLTAGKARSIKLIFPPMEGRRKWAWAVVPFAAGRQVRSYGAYAEVLNHFLSLNEELNHRRLRNERLAGPDAAIEVFRRLPLTWSDRTKAKYNGQTINTVLHINAEGRLQRVELPDLDDRDLLHDFSRNLQWWLFLPEVKDHHELTTIVSVPFPL